MEKEFNHLENNIKVIAEMKIVDKIKCYINEYPQLEPSDFLYTIDYAQLNWAHNKIICTKPEIFDKNKYHEITFTKEENYYYGDIEYISQGEKTCLLNTPNEINVFIDVPYLPKQELDAKLINEMKEIIDKTNMKLFPFASNNTNSNFKNILWSEYRNQLNKLHQFFFNSNIIGRKYGITILDENKNIILNRRIGIGSDEDIEIRNYLASGLKSELKPQPLPLDKKIDVYDSLKLCTVKNTDSDPPILFIYSFNKEFNSILKMQFEYK